MTAQLLWFVGDRNPSITETITINGVAVDLTTATVRFKMRAVGSSTLKVDASATIVSAVAGAVRYDWLGADVDTAGQYLVWWEVTIGGKVQSVAEAVIEFRAHGPDTQPSYVELEQLKSTLELTTEAYVDQDSRRRCPRLARSTARADGGSTSTRTRARFATTALFGGAAVDQRHRHR
jgi:hypothetical protein